MNPLTAEASSFTGMAYQIELFEQSVWTNIHLVSLDHIIPNECRVIFFLCFPYQHQRTQAGNTSLCTPVCHRSYGNGRDLSARILRGESVSPLGDSTMRRHGYLPSSSTGFTISTTFFHSIMFCIMLSDISSFSTQVLIAWAILVWHVRWLLSYGLFPWRILVPIFIISMKFMQDWGGGSENQYFTVSGVLPVCMPNNVHCCEIHTDSRM